MSDREERALAASRPFEVGGKEYKLRPLTLQALVDLEQEALSQYKRQYLETFRENADLFGKDRLNILRQETEKVARWQLHDLPQKEVHDAGRVPVTDAAKKWIEENYGEVPETDNGARAVMVTALDAGNLTRKQVKEMTGRLPIKGRVRFDQWWVTGSMTGMLSFITASIRTDNPGLKKSDIAGWPFAKIAEAARTVESMTSASMGNG